MLKKITLLLYFALLSSISFTQVKKKLDHTVYDTWNSINAVNQSKTGALITYEINPLVGDGNLYIERIDGTLKKQINRGYDATINANETCVVYLIKPQADSVRALRLKKIKEDQLPKDSLAIYSPNTDSTVVFPTVKSYQVAEEGDWVAFLSDIDERPACPQPKKCLFRKKKSKCDRPETSGTTLHLYNVATGETELIPSVKTYLLSKKGDYIVYVSSLKGESDTLSLNVYDLKTKSTTTLLTQQYSIKKLKFDFANEQLVVLHSADTNKRKCFTLSYWEPTMTSAKLVVDSTTAGMPIKWTVSEYCSPYFSRDGSKLYLGSNEIVKQDPKDTLLESEKANVDVWSGFDLKIQPQQLIEKKGEERRNYLGVYHLSTSRYVQLETEDMDRVQIMDHGNSSFALGFSESAYLKSMTWDYPWKSDIYRVTIETGERLLLKSNQAYELSLSPSGNYAVWYEGQDSAWYSSTPTGQPVNMTTQLDALFASDNNGNPYVPEPEGGAGWAKIDSHEYYLVNSRYDIWALCPQDPNLSFSVTNQYGKASEIIYRLNRFDYDSTYLDLTTNLVLGTNDKTKAESLSKIQPHDGNFSKPSRYILKQLEETNHSYIMIDRSEIGDQYILRKMSFIDYPELVSTTGNFMEQTTLTHTNPQQEEYNWGTVEMVEWTSFEGRELRGLLYKPEDFDSTKSYPMITYYYEKYTDNFHNYYSPKPTASIVYPTEYVSNGYLMFIPDIEYTPGHPAKSAYDCIVSGTDYLTQNFAWVDSTRMGLQGQSWGGYQTAQLVTMTNKYKAAMAGAPVSNMFSAYGGVRWGSGLSRMFQYERTQSRIGYTIWEKPELYIENSPIFKLDQVETPLLIMHNDGDGAVPWYQGIELYMGLRRLDQPVWLLNYNGDGHNLMDPANRKDLSIRMRQFFDYYLLDAAMPSWMSDGVPAVDKGKNYGLTPKSE